MADSKDINATSESHADYYEKGPSQEQGRRRSTIADVNRNRNLDAKYVFTCQVMSVTLAKLEQNL